MLTFMLQRSLCLGHLNPDLTPDEEWEEVTDEERSVISVFRIAL